VANYYGDCRSNYFLVKDVEKFKEFLKLWQCSYIDEKPELNKLEKAVVIASNNLNLKVGFISNQDEGLPHYRELTKDEEAHPEIDPYDIGGQDDFLNGLTDHLCKDEVAVIMEVGNEKQCYYRGYAMALCPEKEPVILSLDDIYAKAETAFGVKDITACEY